jgi:maleylacetoacetate isomerase
VLQRLEATLGADQKAKSEWYAHWVALGFTVVESMLSDSAATGRFCHGDTPTLADCCLVPQIYNAERFGVSMVAYPTLRRIGQACLELPAFEQASPDAQADTA